MLQLKNQHSVFPLVGIDLATTAVVVANLTRYVSIAKGRLVVELKPESLVLPGSRTRTLDPAA